MIHRVGGKRLEFVLRGADGDHMLGPSYRPMDTWSTASRISAPVRREWA